MPSPGSPRLASVGLTVPWGNQRIPDSDEAGVARLESEPGAGSQEGVGRGHRSPKAGKGPFACCSFCCLKLQAGRGSVLRPQPCPSRGAVRANAGRQRRSGRGQHPGLSDGDCPAPRRVLEGRHEPHWSFCPAPRKATLADIVEQLQEREAGPGLPAGTSLPQPRELPPGRLPNGLEPPERTPRPDRPRARDRPKPRRRPRPREGGEGGGSRRSRSAPAQGGAAPAPPPPPAHTVQHEGFLLRKREVDANRKSSNRSWVSLYCVLSKGELGFYKDAKGPASGGTHGGEPLLSLHKAISEVASDYKKKKHVFKLQTQDGSEFLLQAKDEEEMNGWLEAVAASVAEHAEIARWGQTLPTTSSTDEGNPKRETGDRRASGRRK